MANHLRVPARRHASLGLCASPDFRRCLEFHRRPSRVAFFEILVETERHAKAVRDLTREYPHTSGNRLHNLHIATLMREHGLASMVTKKSACHAERAKHLLFLVENKQKQIPRSGMTWSGPFSSA